MSKKTKAANSETATTTEKTKAGAKAASVKVVAADPKQPRHCDFVGKVESIAANSRDGASGFEFVLHGRKSVRETFRLDAGNPAIMGIMAQMVISAQSAGEKIGVRVGGNSGDHFRAVEVVCRRKLGKG